MSYEKSWKPWNCGRPNFALCDLCLLTLNTTGLSLSSCKHTALFEPLTHVTKLGRGADE